ncbi:MAG: hypothetical protein GY812_12475 [Actinomycetia bacterium]|nr:hypothetical protein [Actinomycetes bacterium]
MILSPSVASKGARCRWAEPRTPSIHPDLDTNALPAIPEPEEVAREYTDAPDKGSLRIYDHRSV